MSQQFICYIFRYLIILQLNRLNNWHSEMYNTKHSTFTLPIMHYLLRNCTRVYLHHARLFLPKNPIVEYI